MKKLLFAVLVYTTISPLATTWASETSSQVLTLAPGWNIVSTPKVLESHTFSTAETSENFDIYLLDASIPTGWATMADLGQTEFEPLYGYFINNKTGINQTLTFNYQTDLAPNEKLFERTFSSVGWYSIGVANAAYATALDADYGDLNNPSAVLSLLAGDYDLTIDFTDAVYASNRKSVALRDPWKAVVANQINSINDLREGKGYAMYIKESDAKYTGFQNDSSTSDTELLLNQVVVQVTTNGANITDVVDTVSIVVNGIQKQAASIGDEVDYNASTDGTGSGLSEGYSEYATGLNTVWYLFDLETDVAISEFGEDMEITLDLNDTNDGERYPNGTTIQASVGDVEREHWIVTDVAFPTKLNLSLSSNNPDSSDIIVDTDSNTNGVTVTIGKLLPEASTETEVSGLIEGSIHTLFAEGIVIPADGFSSETDTLGSGDTIGEFVLEFEVTAIEEDFYIADNTSSTAPSDGIKYSVEGGEALVSASLTSTADEDTSGVFTVREGETETFTLVVTVDPTATGTFRVSLNEVWYSENTNGADGDVHYLTPASDFRTSFQSIQGS